MRLAFATDQHITKEGETNPFGTDVLQNFIDVLTLIKSRSYDALVLGGDVCFQTGELTTYHKVKSLTDVLQMPVFCIPGNHDDAALLHQVFPQFTLHANGECYGKYDLNSSTAYFLDSSKATMSDEQFEWLEKNLADCHEEEVRIFTHYPPIVTGSKHMDFKYGFTRIKDFADLCRKFSHLDFHVFSGHCHMERTISEKNLTVFITPSSYINIDPDYENFTPLTSQKAGYRECIWEGGSFQTNVFYVD